MDVRHESAQLPWSKLLIYECSQGRSLGFSTRSDPQRDSHSDFDDNHIGRFTDTRTRCKEDVDEIPQARALAETYLNLAFVHILRLDSQLV